VRARARARAPACQTIAWFGAFKLNVDDDDLHISSFTYHPENESATLVITAYAGRAHILLHANYLPAAMHSSEAMAVECRAR